MPEPDDITLLKQYAGGDESSFTTLFERHVHLVYSAALRQARNPSHAEEVTQAVFILLARKAKSLRPKTVLSGWLYQAARLTTASLIKREIRRQRREQEVYMQTLTEPDTSLWEQISPLLDDAMGRLGEKDRNAIVLRFFENRTSQEVAAALKLNEVTARKRVSRALEKLRTFFAKRGVVLTTAIIAGTISGNSVQAAPAALANSATALALAKGATASISTPTLIKGALKLMAWTKAKTLIVSTVVFLLTAGTVTVIVKETPRIDDKWFEWSGARLAPSNLLVIRPTHFSGYHFSGVLNLSPGVLGQRQSLKDLLLAAYRLTSLENGYSSIRVILPKPLPQGYYDYLITLPGDYEEQFQMKIRKQFGLVGRMEIIETNVLLLKITNPSSRELQRSQGNKPWVSFDSAGNLCGTNVSVSTLAGYVENKLKIPVVDKTDLEGNYNFTLHYPLGDRQKDQNEFRTSLLNQLGLELVPGREPVEMLVVERVKD